MLGGNNMLNIKELNEKRQNIKNSINSVNDLLDNVDKRRAKIASLAGMPISKMIDAKEKYIRKNKKELYITTIYYLLFSMILCFFLLNLILNCGLLNLLGISFLISAFSSGINFVRTKRKLKSNNYLKEDEVKKLNDLENEFKQVLDKSKKLSIEENNLSNMKFQLDTMLKNIDNEIDKLIEYEVNNNYFEYPFTYKLK